MKRALIGATIALSVLLPLGVASATPDPNQDKGKDCEDHGNNEEAHHDDDHCLTTTVTTPPTTTTQSSTTTAPTSTTTTTQSAPNPCDNQEIVDQDNCPTTTTTVSSTSTLPPTTTNPPCIEGCQTTTTTTSPTTTTNPPCVERCQTTTTTTTATVPPPTTTVPSPTTAPSACSGSVRLGNWYADPQVNISLRGKGTFKVIGGIQRFSHRRTIVATLGCGETLKVPHYKVKHGHALKVYQDGKLVIKQVPPRID